MKKFCVYTERFEIRVKHGMPVNFSESDIRDLINNESCREPVLVGTFDTLEAAKSVAATESVSTRLVKSNVFDLIVGSVVYVAVEEWTDDGEDFDYLDYECDFRAEHFSSEEEEVC